MFKSQAVYSLVDVSFMYFSSKDIQSLLKSSTSSAFSLDQKEFLMNQAYTTVQCTDVILSKIEILLRLKYFQWDLCRGKEHALRVQKRFH